MVTEPQAGTSLWEPRLSGQYLMVIHPLVDGPTSPSLKPFCYQGKTCISISFQETLERLEECSGNAVSQSEMNIPATYAAVLPPSNNRTERPVWTAPRRYPRSPSPLAQPLPQPLPGPPLRPIRSPAHSPGSSPRSFSPIRKARPPVGIPTSSHLPVEAECAEPCDQTQCPSQQ